MAVAGKRVEYLTIGLLGRKSLKKHFSNVDIKVAPSRKGCKDKDGQKLSV